MILKAFPKIYALGSAYIPGIFDEPVEVTEKIDGSQFVFGKVGGEVQCRSKGAEIFMDNPDKMFSRAVDTVRNMDLPDHTIFYTEYLMRPKHNILSYASIPTNHLVLFGVSDEKSEIMCADHSKLASYAEELGIDVVPLIHQGPLTPEDALAFLERDSYLGGAKIEGFVVKNYKQCLIANHPHPLMAGKFVSEKFKEKHAKDWKKENTAGGRWDVIKSQYRTEARWLKAVQHLREKEQLSREPKDIGALIKEVQLDISQEESEDIKAILWGLYGKDLLRRSTAGLPEWYKEQLALGEI